MRVTVDETVRLMFILPPVWMAGLLVVLAAMVAYWLIKFVASLFTGG